MIGSFKLGLEGCEEFQLTGSDGKEMPGNGVNGRLWEPAFQAEGNKGWRASVIKAFYSLMWLYRVNIGKEEKLPKALNAHTKVCTWS